MDNPNIVKVKEAVDEQLTQAPFYEQRTKSTINLLEEESWSQREEGGYKVEFPRLMNAFEGISKGFYIIAGETNIGKSAIMMAIAWQLARNNDPIHVIYYAIDDDETVIAARLLAMMARIPISVVVKPKKWQKTHPELVLRRDQAIKEFRETVPKSFSIVSSVHLGGNSIELVTKDVARIYNDVQARYGHKNIVVCVDALHDLTTTSYKLNESVAATKYISSQLKDEIMKKYKVPVLVTAELRKSDKQKLNARPTLDDIRDSSAIKYDSDVAMLCYSEVQLNLPDPKVYYTRSDKPSYQKFPVLEVNVLKNKLSDFKAHLFYELVPEMSVLHEADETRSRYYLDAINGLV